MTSRPKYNPVYALSTADEKAIFAHFVPSKIVNDENFIFYPVFAENNKEMAKLRTALVEWHERTLLRLMPKFRKAVIPKKTVLSVAIPSSIKEPHRVLTDGSIIKSTFEENAGAVRIYPDGSRVPRLLHAVAICIDDKMKTIIMQNPRGHSFDIPTSKPLKDMLECLFFDYKIIDLQLNQQKEDRHSCSFLALYSAICFAKGILPVEDINIQKLRTTYLDSLPVRNVSKDARIYDQLYCQ